VTDTASFTRYADGFVTVAGWPAELAITEELIRSADPKFIRASRRVLSIGVANGWAIYKLRWFKRTVNGIRHYRLKSCALGRTVIHL
jgi:hypothetical protein